MGFWHTGYIEFHEPVGFDSRFKPAPQRFKCSHCEQIFDFPEDLRHHRFENHPLHRPTMFLFDLELGSHPVRITRQLSPEDLRIEGCDRAILNGCEIDISGLGQQISKISNDVCRVVLGKSGVIAEFQLDIRVAAEQDLLGVEDQFRRIALGKRLDVRAVEEFISTSMKFKTAVGYCDGICDYLYGVLAKERAPDSSLSYEAYIGRFSKSTECLAAYDRPLSRTIGSIIEFHFNHFKEAFVRSPSSRVGAVSDRFSKWLENRKAELTLINYFDNSSSGLECLVTDLETERIIRWNLIPTINLANSTDEIESFIEKDISEFDKVKLHILLAEVHAVLGNTAKAIKNAKYLRNYPFLEKWAEALIRALSEDKS